MDEQPVPIMAVLDRAVDALLVDTHGVFRIPAGGYLNVTWLSKKRAYRVTIDVMPDYWPSGLGVSPRLTDKVESDA